ncbi:hypothetical protein CDL12_03647 [Handroanthus impetiginosus]|uniref:Uncharacterized protein n=1 Tax=Handroanthus impetiginosus TaxID=429701 RepID=A0A2G9I1J6_9LAMI|nr:hypothetical protein CDL12_03647 [Handroanthus impetiginosus]
MAEATKVRVVRCPKCENLIPELSDFSLYQCDGCGAVLKAKKKGILEDGLSEISDDVNGRGMSGEGGIVKVSEVVMESVDGIEVSRAERTRDEGAASDGSFKSCRELPVDSDIHRRGKERIGRVDSFEDECRSYSQGLVRNRNHGKNSELNVDRPEYVGFQGEHVKESRPPMDSLRSRPLMDKWGVKSNGLMAPSGPPRSVRFDDLPYHDEGQSSYVMSSYYEHGERYRYRGHDLDGVSRIENLENGRAELLRRLDELKEQISRSCNVDDKPKERNHADRRVVSPTSPDTYPRHHSTYVQDGLTSSQGVKKQAIAPDDMVPPYFDHPRGFVPYTDRYSSRVLDSYPQGGYPHEFPHYVDPYTQEMRRRPSRPLQSQYMQRPYDEHFCGYHGDVNHDLFMLHRHENFFHQPACSCVHCCDNNWHMPPKADPPGLHNQRCQIEQSNPSFHQRPNPIMHRPQGNSSGGSNLYPLHSRQSLTLNSNDPDSENDGLHYHRPRKMVVAHRSGRLSYPIAGAAPFITCSNCFELLKIPRKHISLAINEQKMKCGACSSIILFELARGFIASASAHVDQVPTEIDEGSIGTADENIRYWNDGSNSANMNTCPNEYDDTQHKLSATEKKSNSGESDKHLDPLSSTSSLSDDEPIREKSTNHESPSTKLSPQEFPDHSPENVAVGRLDKGNESTRPELEKGSLDRTTSQQSSVKDAAVATEIDVSLNEFSNSYASQDSVETSKKDDHPKVIKGGESFFAGLIKKGLRDFRKSNQDAEVGGPHVFVNGHFIPDRVVKKAEKLAGSIQPGEYWYDKKAGFWGVMGHPCLGIIMPNIEEFNYPMPENCAAGNTDIFVNGRELHQKDLDLLANRGLPITRHRSYLIEISGKVIDEQTGEELDGLGKLAPTVVKAKHGFGMKVPRFLAQSQS